VNVNGSKLKLAYFGECAEAASKLWLIKGVLAANETSTLIGPPGGGKSALGTDIAVHYAQVKDWRGHRIKEPGGVVYFAFERADLVKRRLHAYRLRDNLPPDLPIAVVGQIINLMDPHCVDLILPALKEAEQKFGQAVRISVFDTYNKGIAIGGGDEDKAKDQNRALGHLRRLQEKYPGLHVMAIGHTGKDEGRGARGSNALPGDADVQNQISTAGDIKIVTTTKANDAPEGELLRFKLEPYVFGADEDGDPVSAHIVAAETIPAGGGVARSGERWPRGLKLVHEAITEALINHGKNHNVAGNGPGVMAVTVQDARATHKGKYVSTGEGDRTEAERKSWQRSFKEAQNRQLVCGEVIDGRELIWLRDNRDNGTPL